MRDASFKDFVLDQLTGLPALRSRAMFGGHGLYQGGAFFGILLDGRLYFKTDARTRVAYQQRGCGPFIYEKARRTISLTYYEVPTNVLENREELVAWALDAVRCAKAVSTKRKRQIRDGASGKPRGRLRSGRWPRNSLA